MGVLQDFEGEPQVFGNTPVIVQLEGFSLSRQIVEYAFFLCFLDPFFYQAVQIFHKMILTKTFPNSGTDN